MNFRTYDDLDKLSAELREAAESWDARASEEAAVHQPIAAVLAVVGVHLRMVAHAVDEASRLQRVRTTAAKKGKTDG